MKGTILHRLRQKFSPDSPARDWLLYGMLATIPVFITMVFYVNQFGTERASNHTTWAEFGDFFGGILNPLFAFLAFIAVLITIKVQSREMHESSKSLAEQSIQLGQQSIHLGIQSFENTLFSLLGMHAENVRTLAINHGGREIVGRATFSFLNERLLGIYEEKSAEMSGTKGTTETQVLEATYEDFYARYEAQIGHYVRAVDRLFDLLEKRGSFKVPEKSEEQIQYWLIVRAQLSTDELSIIFYHFLLRPDFFEFQKLVDNDVFRYLSENKLLSKRSHKKFLNKSE